MYCYSSDNEILSEGTQKGCNRREQQNYFSPNCDLWGVRFFQTGCYSPKHMESYIQEMMLFTLHYKK